MLGCYALKSLKKGLCPQSLRASLLGLIKSLFCRLPAKFSDRLPNSLAISQLSLPADPFLRRRLLSFARRTMTPIDLSKGLLSGLTDNSSPGDWRLPTKDEWTATVARAVALTCAFGTPHLTNDVGKACYDTGVGSSFTDAARRSSGPQ